MQKQESNISQAEKTQKPLTKSTKIQLAILLAVLSFTGYQGYLFFNYPKLSSASQDSKAGTKNKPGKPDKLLGNPLDYIKVLKVACPLTTLKGATLNKPAFAIKFGKSDLYIYQWQYSCDLSPSEVKKFYTKILTEFAGKKPTYTARSHKLTKRYILAAKTKSNEKISITFVEKKNKISKIIVVHYRKPNPNDFNSAKKYSPSYLQKLTKELPKNYRPLEPKPAK